MPICLAIVGLTLPGCGDGSGGGNGEAGGSDGTVSRSTPFLSLGTAPVGGAFQVVGGAIAEVLNDHIPDNAWKKINAKGTKGSRQNIRDLQSGDLQIALSNSAISYFAVRGESGWEDKYNIRAVATLAPNVAMFITKADSGIKSLADLKGKTVVIGPSGAGFEMFVQPLLKGHGITYEDMTVKNSTQTGSVDMLGDGSADAVFLGGAVPTASITQACSTYDIFFIPFGADEVEQLVTDYPFFQKIPVTQDKYTDLTADFAGMNVGSMHLITHADQSDELVYQLTKTMWENRTEIADKHPAGRAINEKNVARFTGTEFHPGAIKFYQEIGIWPEDAAEDVEEPAAASAGE